MSLTLLPLLAIQRDLLTTERGFARFSRYLGELTAGTDDLALPLAAFNPMSKPHVAELLDQFLAADAEAVAQATLAAAARRLGPATPDLRVGLVVVDDALGGWTNRYLTDLAHRTGGAGELKRGFLTAYLWTGESPSLAALQTEVQAVIYRAAYKQRYGYPTTLGEIVRLEGLTGLFAAVPAPVLPDLAHCRALLAQYHATTATPVIVAYLYGDAAAESLGYPPLGVSAWGGLAYAVHLARLAGWEPLAALQSLPALPFTSEQG